MSDRRPSLLQPHAPVQRGAGHTAQQGQPTPGAPARTLQQQQAVTQLTRLVPQPSGSMAPGSSSSAGGGSSSGGVRGPVLVRAPSARGLRVDAAGSHHPAHSTAAPMMVMVQPRFGGGVGTHAPAPPLHPRPGSLGAAVRAALPGALGVATALHAPSSLPPLAACGAGHSHGGAQTVQTSPTLAGARAQRPVSGVLRASVPQPHAAVHPQQQSGAPITRHLSIHHNQEGRTATAGAGLLGSSMGLGRNASMPHAAVNRPARITGLAPLPAAGTGLQQPPLQPRGGALASPQPTLAAVAAGLVGPGANAAALHSFHYASQRLMSQYEGESIGGSGVWGSQSLPAPPVQPPVPVSPITPIRLLQRNVTSGSYSQPQATQPGSGPTSPATPTAPAPIPLVQQLRTSLQRLPTAGTPSAAAVGSVASPHHGVQGALGSSAVAPPLQHTLPLGARPLPPASSGGGSTPTPAAPAPITPQQPQLHQLTSIGRAGTGSAAPPLQPGSAASFQRRGPLLAPRSAGGSGGAQAAGDVELQAGAAQAARGPASPVPLVQQAVLSLPTPVQPLRVEPNSGCSSRGSSRGSGADTTRSPGLAVPLTPSPAHPAFQLFPSPERAWTMYSSAAGPGPGAGVGGGSGDQQGARRAQGLELSAVQPVAPPPPGTRLTPIPLQPLQGPPQQQLQQQQQYAPAHQQASWWSTAPEAAATAQPSVTQSQPYHQPQPHRFAVGLEGLLLPHPPPANIGAHSLTQQPLPLTSPPHSSLHAAAAHHHSLLHHLEHHLLAQHTAGLHQWGTGGAGLAGAASGWGGQANAEDYERSSSNSSRGSGSGEGSSEDGASGFDDARTLGGHSGDAGGSGPESMRAVVAALYAQFVHPASASAASRPGSQQQQQQQQQQHPHHHLTPYLDSRGGGSSSGDGGLGLGGAYFGPLGTGYAGWGSARDGGDDEEEEEEVVGSSGDDGEDGGGSGVMYLGAGHLGVVSDEDEDDDMGGGEGAEASDVMSHSSCSSACGARGGGSEPVTARWRSHTPLSQAQEAGTWGAASIDRLSQRSGSVRTRSSSSGSSGRSSSTRPESRVSSAGPPQVLGPHGFRRLLPPGALDAWAGPPMTPESRGGGAGGEGAAPRFRRGMERAGAAAGAAGTIRQDEGEGMGPGRPVLHFIPPPSAPAAVTASRSEGGLTGMAPVGGGAGDMHEDDSRPDSGSDGLSNMLRLPFQHFMSRHAANLLLPHHMRHMADMFTPDMLWRQPLPASHGPGSGSSAGGPSGGTAATASNSHGANSGTHSMLCKAPSARSGSRGASRGGAGAAGGGAGGVAPAGLREVSAVELFCGRYPPKAVRGLAGEPGFMSELLGSLPGVDAAAPCVAAVCAGLQGRSVLASVHGPLGPGPGGPPVAGWGVAGMNKGGEAEAGQAVARQVVDGAGLSAS